MPWVIAGDTRRLGRISLLNPTSSNGPLPPTPRPQRNPPLSSGFTGRGTGHRGGGLRLHRPHPEQAAARHFHPRCARSEGSAGGVADFPRRPGFAQPQGAGRGRYHDREQRAQHDADRPPRRGAAAAARKIAGIAEAGTHPQRARGKARHQGIRHSHGRGGRAQSLRAGRVPHLRRCGSDETEAPRLSENRRNRRAPLRHGRALRLHLHRDGRLPGEYPRHLRHPQAGEAAGSFALVDAGTEPCRRRKTFLGGEASPAAPRAALRGQIVGRLLERGRARDRRLRHSRSQNNRRIQLTPAVPGAFAHLHAGAVRNRRPAHRARDRRRGPRARREGSGAAPRPAARLPVGAGRDRPHAHQAAFDLRSQRTGFALEPRHARTLRRAPVPGAHERHTGVLLLVRGRPAHRRRRRPAGAAGSRLLHPRARSGKGRAADQRRRRRSARTDLHRRPLRRIRRPGTAPLTLTPRAPARAAPLSARWCVWRRAGRSPPRLSRSSGNTPKYLPRSSGGPAVDDRGRDDEICRRAEEIPRLRLRSGGQPGETLGVDFFYMVASDRTTADTVDSRIVVVRGLRVLLDADLAGLYGVEVKALNQAVRRNLERFPADFMFQLSWDEAERSRSQIVTLIKTGERGGNIKYRPYAFTEQGVAMLSSVLRSKRAAQVNVEIMRAFVRLRGLIGQNQELARRIGALESKYDRQFKVVFDAIRELMTPPPPVPKRRIGFVQDE